MRGRVCRYVAESVALTLLVACSRETAPEPLGVVASGAQAASAPSSVAAPAPSGAAAPAPSGAAAPAPSGAGSIPAGASAAGSVAAGASAVPSAPALLAPSKSITGALPAASAALPPTTVASAVAASGAASAAPTGSAAATKSAGPAVVRRHGPTASGESYDTWLETTGGYAVGSSSAALLVLSAKSPFKCNTQYPYKLALDAPPPGVTYPSSVARGMQVDGKHASMNVPFVAVRAGSFPIGGTLSFSTCTPEKCLVDKARVSVVVDVN